MPDTLTPEEKHLIAEAVAAGRVRRIPRGVRCTTNLTWWSGAGRAARLRIRRRQARFARAATKTPTSAGGATRAPGATTAKTPTPPKGPF